MTNISKSHQYINREKTPKWLDEKVLLQSKKYMHIYTKL
uniref:Uncharacterized protein n=1 Tax=Staphylococcus epidermidis TaxID=1282 RepID=D2JC88_STAEP|nr:hypothetical protein SAP106A_031 [Staphylococcus epidermidis]